MVSNTLRGNVGKYGSFRSARMVIMQVLSHDPIKEECTTVVVAIQCQNLKYKKVDFKERTYPDNCPFYNMIDDSEIVELYKDNNG